MPKRVVPKPAGRRNMVPERVWRRLRAAAAGWRPRASTSARWSMIIVTGSSGANDPSGFLAIHPWRTATAAYRYQALDASRSGKTIEGSGASLAAKSRIQSFVAATNRIPSFAHASDAVRSEKRIGEEAVVVSVRPSGALG